MGAVSGMNRACTQGALKLHRPAPPLPWTAPTGRRVR
jgi:hypothetical protein